MGNTYFNTQQIKDIFLNNQRFKKMYLGINIIWDYLANAFSSFKSRVLADAGTFENDNAINDLTAELLQEASLVITPNAVKTSKLYAVKPDNGTGDLTVTRATTATRVNESGVIVDVPANTARIDYSTGKGLILVEPQRTNLILQSSTLSGWSITNIIRESVSTDNPFGVNTVTRFTENNINGVHQFLEYKTINPPSYISFSFYVKSAGINSFRFGGNWDFLTSFNLTTGVFSGSSVSKYKSINMGNGWWRVIFTDLVPDNYTRSYVIRLSDSGAREGLGIFVYGVQLELGSNATSYIPTTSASVTRNTDVISKTGISSLIGQTEGTIFIDVTLPTTEDRRLFSLSGTGGISNNRLTTSFGSGGRYAVDFIYNGSFTQIFTDKNQPFSSKLCVKYNNTSYKLFLNGVLINTNNSLTPLGLSELYIGSYGVGNQNLNGFINKFLLFKTQLTDQECINLTL